MTELTPGQKRGIAVVDRAVARGKITEQQAGSWRDMARLGADPAPGLAALPENTERAVANSHALAAAAAVSPAAASLGVAAPPAALPAGFIGAELAR